MESPPTRTSSTARFASANRSFVTPLASSRRSPSSRCALDRQASQLTRLVAGEERLTPGLCRVAVKHRVSISTELSPVPVVANHFRRLEGACADEMVPAQVLMQPLSAPL